MMNQIKMKESFEDGQHILKFTVPPLLTTRHTRELIITALADTLVTPEVFERGHQTVMENLPTLSTEVTWRYNIAEYSTYAPHLKLRYSDIMMVVDSLSESEAGVITQFTCIPFDPATGFYLGMETDSGDPFDAYTSAPEIQEQLHMGRTIDSDSLSGLLNRVACDGQTPAWLDDETGNVFDSLADYGSWSQKVCYPDSVRMWFRSYRDASQFRNILGMAVKAQGLSVSQPWDNEKMVCLHAQRLFMTSLNIATPEELEENHHEATGNSVEDAVFAIQEASFIWDRMLRGNV